MIKAKKVYPPKNYLELLKIKVEKMHNKPVNFKRLALDFSPYFKTEVNHNYQHISLRLKNGGGSLSLSRQPRINNVNAEYFKVLSSRGFEWNIEISAQTNKELLQKIIKHNFFNN